MARGEASVSQIKHELTNAFARLTNWGGAYSPLVLLFVLHTAFSGLEGKHDQHVVREK